MIKEFCIIIATIFLCLIGYLAFEEYQEEEFIVPKTQVYRLSILELEEVDKVREKIESTGYDKQVASKYDLKLERDHSTLSYSLSRWIYLVPKPQTWSSSDQIMESIDRLSQGKIETELDKEINKSISLFAKQPF